MDIHQGKSENSVREQELPQNNSLIESDAKMDVHQEKSEDFVREQEQVLSKSSLRESDAKMDHYQESLKMLSLNKRKKAVLNLQVPFQIAAIQIFSGPH